MVLWDESVLSFVIVTPSLSYACHEDDAVCTPLINIQKISMIYSALSLDGWYEAGPGFRL